MSSIIVVFRIAGPGNNLNINIVIPVLYVTEVRKQVIKQTIKSLSP